MVVDDIQDDAKAKVVGTINEGAEGVWVSTHGRRVRTDAVVSPAESSRELGDRHHFYGCDADPLQTLEMFCRGAPGSGASKGTEHAARRRPVPYRDARPGRVPPAIQGRIHNLRGSERTIGLKPRCGVGE